MWLKWWWHSTPFVQTLIMNNWTNNNFHWRVNTCQTELLTIFHFHKAKSGCGAVLTLFWSPEVGLSATKYGPLAKIWVVKKKHHPHNFQNWAGPLKSRLPIVYGKKWFNFAMLAIFFETRVNFGRPLLGLKHPLHPLATHILDCLDLRIHSSI